MLCTMLLSAVAFAFDNTYARELQGFHVPWKPTTVPEPRLLFFNRPLAEELGLGAGGLEGLTGLDGLEGQDAAALWAGNALPEGAQPIAQAYAGHQFGGFSPQLGDGRALLLGEVIDRHGQRRDIAFKGSGRTPFSRGGDGKAAVGPMLREVLISEALHALGIPTTRALAVAGTGERVVRERVLPGAVLTRVAASHLRVGTFQYFAARRETERVRQLADYAIARHDPALRDIDRAPERTLAFFRAVARRQAALVAQWMNVGFIHGVMNTDNMTISGESIDFGPCAFMEAFDPQTVFSSIDHGGRYAYGNQPHIARWNLARLAETLLPLIDAQPQRAVELATQALDAFVGWFEAALRSGPRGEKTPPTRPLPPWRTTGWLCCSANAWMSRKPGDFWRWRRMRRMRRMRPWPHPHGCARCSTSPRRFRHGSHAGAHNGRTGRWNPPRAPLPCAGPIPGSLPATTGWRRPWPPPQARAIWARSSACCRRCAAPSRKGLMTSPWPSRHPQR